MADDPSGPTLEERKLALDEKRLENDYNVRIRELELKAEESGWFNRLFSPLTTTLFAGILTLAGTALGAFITGRSTLSLEREKSTFSQKLETQKQQHELVLKMISVPDTEQAKENMKFLAESGLIADEKLVAKIRAATEVATPRIPPTVDPVQQRVPDDRFVGVSRRLAKLSIGTGAIESFKDVIELVSSLPSLAELKARIPTISNDANSERVADE